MMKFNIRKYIYLMGVVLLAACGSEDVPVAPIPTPETKPVEPATPKAALSITTSIANRTESRAVVEQWEKGHTLAVWAGDNRNVAFAFDGTKWTSEKEIDIDKDTEVTAVFPYDINNADCTNIPIDITLQDDYMYGKAIASVDKSNADITMTHALTLVRFLIKKNDYRGEGKVTDVTISGVYKAATMDAVTGLVTAQGETGQLKVGGNYTLDDAQPVYNDAILVPVTTGQGIVVKLAIDGKTYDYSIPQQHEWRKSTRYTYTLNMKSGYDCAVDLEDVPLDVEYWSDYGKTDNMVVRECGNDWMEIKPNYCGYGYDTYTGEGKVFGMFFSYFNWAGDENFVGEARFCLEDASGKVVEKYPPFSIHCDAGGWNGARNNCFIQAVPGTYTLVPLFRKQGESMWFKAMQYENNGTKEEWQYEVKAATDAPALRMITLENQKCNTFVVYEVPDADPFNIVYTISNRSLKALSGEIKVTWEREFKLKSNSYRPSHKRSGYTNDDEYVDILAQKRIDVPAGTRFWKGIIECRFPVKRLDAVGTNGVAYATPSVHVYYKADGSSEWVLLRLDAEYLFNRNYTGNDIYDEAMDYIYIMPQSW